MIATGVAYRQLESPGVDDFLGRGVHYGASTEGAPGYRDRAVVVVGGANSAGQAALHLAGYARDVTMVVRGKFLAEKMSSYLVERIAAHDRITVPTRSAIARAEGRTSPGTSCGRWTRRRGVAGCPRPVRVDRRRPFDRWSGRLAALR